MQIPASNLGTDGFHRLVRNCGTEIDKELTFAILRSPRPKCIAEKIELLVRIRPSPVIILAIDNFRLFRMKFQPTLLQTRGYGTPNLLSLRLFPAMHDGIIGIPFERYLWILLRYPSVKSIVQK